MNLHELAKLGVAVRIKELQEEIKELRKLNPFKKVKRIHWTQTPEGKARLSKSMKESWKKKKN